MMYWMLAFSFNKNTNKIDFIYSSSSTIWTYEVPHAEKQITDESFVSRLFASRLVESKSFVDSILLIVDSAVKCYKIKS